ncbi:MAG: redoxin domain-containing (seleno)protein, partial [Actinobacteria bacterium]|nr:redoxin domain-containing (seleno)protein [Actinomycetota bacterium]
MTVGLIINQNGETASVEVASNFGEFAISLDDFATITGWQLKPEGLCIAENCVPVRDAKMLTNHTHIDLIEFARVTNQNIAV